MMPLSAYGFLAALWAASCAPRAADDDCDVHTWQAPDEANRGRHIFFAGRVAYDTTASSLGGTVVDAHTGTPLAGVVISINSTARTERDTTDAEGRFFLMQPCGRVLRTRWLPLLGGKNAAFWRRARYPMPAEPTLAFAKTKSRPR